MLSGRPVLIVEAEFLIALDIQRMLELFDVGQTLLARNAAEARQMKATWPDIALAIVEMQLDDMSARHLASELSSQGIALIITTGHVDLVRGAHDIVPSPVCLKPFSEQVLASAVQQALARTHQKL